MSDKFVVALNEKGRAFRWRLRQKQGRSWRRVNGHDLEGRAVILKQVAVNGEDRLCGVSKRRELYCKKGYGLAWTKVPVYNGWPAFVVLYLLFRVVDFPFFC